MNINEEDLKLKLLASLPIQIDKKIKVYPLKLKEISEIGYSKYNQYLSLLTFNISDIINQTEDKSNDEQLQQLTTFDVVMSNIINEDLNNVKSKFKDEKNASDIEEDILNEYNFEEDYYFSEAQTSNVKPEIEESECFKKNVLSALSLFLKKKVDVYYTNESAFFYINNKNFFRKIRIKKSFKKNNTKKYRKIYGFRYGSLIHTENIEKTIGKESFNDIRYILRLANGIDKTISENDEFDPADEATRKLCEQMKKYRKKVQEIKSRDGDEDYDENERLTLYDLVSILTTNSNSINLLNVWKLDFYQFNIQFNRLQMFEEFNLNVHSLLAGASSEDVKLKNWKRKIK